MTIDRALELQARAWTLQAEGNLDDAFAACHEALLLTEQCEGSDSADVANLLNDLAEIECDRQKFQAALTYSERALAIEKAHLNRFTGEMAARIRLKTLALLGALRRLQGDYVRAENDLQEAARHRKSPRKHSTISPFFTSIADASMKGSGSTRRPCE